MTLLLTLEEVKSILNMKDVMNAVERAFELHAKGLVQMPPKVYLSFEKGDLRAMPAQVGKYAGVKWVNSHPYNKNLPTVMALLILNDPENGYPLSVMDGTYITCMRTGAAGGIAAKYLARKDSSTFGFIGCGTQAYYQLEALREVYEIEKVLAFDLNGENVEKFTNHCKELGINAYALECKKVCKCDVLTTTTPSKKPIVKEEWIEEGTHINAIGADAPGKQELDEKLLLKAKVVVDDVEQSMHGGEINVAVSKGIFSQNDIYATIGEVIAGYKKGRESEKEITIFDSTGLAIQDIATASLVFEKAKSMKIGRELNFI